MDWISSFLGGSTSGLQSSGEISKERLLEFFAKGRGLFASKEFGEKLRLGFLSGASTQDIINQAQEALFVEMGIYGQYGISYLGKVRKAYSNDAEMLRFFYEFVHLEERALDEAELSEADFKSKYEKLEAMQKEMLSKQAELASLSPEDRNALMASVMKKVVNATGEQCCDAHGQCQHSNRAPPVPMDQADGSANMTEEEQLKFFQSLTKGE